MCVPMQPLVHPSPNRHERVLRCRQVHCSVRLSRGRARQGGGEAAKDAMGSVPRDLSYMPLGCIFLAREEV